jgi:hypothetical protein
MSENPWDKLAGAAARAAAHGDWKQAAELGYAARKAWENHCEAVEAQQEGKQDLQRGRGR